MSSAPSESVIDALRRAARSGSGLAAFILGRLFAEGWGVPRDLRQAFKWYQSSARKGFRDALYCVAFAYYVGEGVRANPRKAFEYFVRASRAGDLVAEYMSALCILDGTGARKNEKLGLQKLHSAARKGSSDAMDFLAARHLRMGDIAAARRWANKAIEAGNTVAALRLREINAAAARRSSGGAE